MDNQVTVIGIDAVFGSSGCRLSLSITTRWRRLLRFPADRAPRCAPTGIHATIEGKQVWCSLEDNIWHTSIRTIGGTVIRTLLPFAVPAPASFQFGSSRHHRSGRFHLLGPYCTGKRRAHTIKVDRSWLGCISNGIKLPSISTPVTEADQTTAGFAHHHPDASWHSHPRCFFPTGKDGVYHRKVEVRILTLPPRLRRPCGSVTCTVHQTGRYWSGGWSSPIRHGCTQFRRQIQCLKRHGQRRIVAVCVTCTLRPERVILPCGSPLWWCPRQRPLYP